MKKVLISIIHPIDLFGPRIGGIGTFIKSFIKYAPSKFEIEFIGVTSDEHERPAGMRHLLRIGGKEIRFFPLLFEKNENRKAFVPLSLRFTLALKFSCLDFSNKILHFHRLEPALFFNNSKQPKLVFIHNDVQAYLDKSKSEVTWGHVPSLYKWVEACVIKFVDHIYTVSTNTLNLYKSQYPHLVSKCSFLPTFMDTEIFFPSDCPKETIRKKLLKQDDHSSLENKTWIVYVGRLSGQKNPSRLVETFAKYQSMNRESCLFIIGDGELKQQVENDVEKKRLSQSVRLIGTKSQKDVAEYFRAADVMLLTSNFEGMPIAVLEALACGLPVVSTDVGEVRQVVKAEHSGEVVKDFSPDSLADALNIVLQNPGKYRKENCLESTSNFTPLKVLKPVYEMCESLYSTFNE